MNLIFGIPSVILATMLVLPSCKTVKNNFSGFSQRTGSNSSGASLTQETKISETEDQAPATTEETKVSNTLDPELEEKYTDSNQPENDPSQSEDTSSDDGQTKKTDDTAEDDGPETSPCDDTDTIRYMEGHPPGWTNGGTAKKYGKGPGNMDWSLCPH